MQATAIIASLDDLRTKLKKVNGGQIFSGKLKGELGALGTEYFSSYRPAALAAGVSAEEMKPVDAIFSAMRAASYVNPSKAKCDGLCKSAKAALIKLESVGMVQAPVAGAKISESDKLIVSSLREVCPSAAAAYEQALRDLQGGERLSWRGPATDMREALRETLDALAPDEDVSAEPSFKLEQGTHRPSMRQKAKYILKERGLVGNQINVSDTTIGHVEDAVSAITRSVYVRSNVSTHTPTSRDEVARLHGWVRLVMCDLLSLPIE